MAFPQGKAQEISYQQQLDSVLYHYQLSREDSLSIPKRLQYVSISINKAEILQQDSLIYKGLMNKTWLFGKIQEYDSAIFYSNQLYDFAKRNGDTLFMIKAIKKLAFYNSRNDQLATAFSYYNKVFKMARLHKDSVEAGKNLLYMANIQTALGDYSGSKTTAIDGVKYMTNTLDLRCLSGLYHIISVANREQKNYKEALKYNTLAIALGKDSTAINTIGVKNILIFKNTKAIILAKQQNYKEAVSILRKLSSDSIVQQDQREYARIIGNLGYVEWLANEDNQNTEALLLKALRVRKKIKDVEGLIASNIYLTKYYLDIDKEKALTYAEAAYQNAQKIKSLTSILEALGFIFEVKENTNAEAKVFNQVHQELQELNQSNREIYAVTRYENDKLTNENLILKAETARKERQQVLYIFGAVLLFIAGGFVIYRFRQQYKREKIREVYNAETRISKKIHDELANDVYHVMTRIQHDVQDVDEDVLDKLEDIYSRTRDISRENSGFTTGNAYQQELENMLNSYGSAQTRIMSKDIDQVNWAAIAPEKKVVVHRILQELMINMKKHSHANIVVITFAKNKKNIKITYADNGVGIAKNRKIHNSGLRNAENRIKSIKGTFIFDSDKDKGFKAKIQFPN
ncbi:tetratricopeptide repeat-containing sensor histidine kinase [Aquimarina algicola]|nr:hypothetical protein [Aquimarina algicola]